RNRSRSSCAAAPRATRTAAAVLAAVAVVATAVAATVAAANRAPHLPALPPPQSAATAPAPPPPPAATANPLNEGQSRIIGKDCHVAQFFDFTLRLFQLGYYPTIRVRVDLSDNF